MVDDWLSISEEKNAKMIENLVSSLLVPYLQQYVENFDKKNLNIAVLRGVASLKDVKLKEYALDNISDLIPFYISFSHISLLEFDVPYTSLNTKSVICKLKDVYIVLRPKLKRPYNKEDEKNRMTDLKRHVMDQFERDQVTKYQKEKEKENQKAGAEEAGFFDKLIETIINNLSIKVENIHVRYQDDNNCVAGFSLESMEIHSTDENFEKRFRRDLGELAYKMFSMAKLAVYLNPWSEEEAKINYLLSAGVSDEQVIQHLQSITERVYLLKPVDGCLRLTMQKLSTKGIDFNRPQFNADFEFLNDIQMCLSQKQYNSIFKIIEYMSNYSIQSQYRHLRPDEFDAASYWQYAIGCVNHQRRQERTSKMYQTVMSIQCKEYVKLYKMIQKVPWIQQKPTPEDELRFKKIEEQRTIQELLYFRKCAHKEISQESKIFEEQQKKRKSSWFSTDRIQEKAIELSDKMKEELYKSIGYEEQQAVEIPDDYVKVRIHFLLAKVSFVIYHETNSLLELVVDGFLSDIQILPHKAFKYCASMGNLTLFDKYNDTLYPEIITKSKRKRDSGSEKLLSLFLEKRPNTEKVGNESDIYLSVFLNQIDIVINFEFFQRVLSFVYFDNVNIKRLEKEAKMQFKKVSKLAKKEIKEVLMQDDTSVDLSFNIKAPQIIIPWSPTNPESRFLLIDFGQFTLSKDSSMANREKFDINLDNMEIVVPKGISAKEYLDDRKDIAIYDVIMDKSSLLASAMKHKDLDVEEKVQVSVNVPCIKFVLSKESMEGITILAQQIAEFKQNPTGTKEKTNDLKIMGVLAVNHEDTDFSSYFVEVSATKKIFFYTPDHKYLKVIVHLNRYTKVHESTEENQFYLELPQKKGYQTKYIYFRCASKEEKERWASTIRMFIYSFDTNFFIDDLTDILKEASFSDDEDEEEEKSGVLMAVRFNLDNLILSLLSENTNLASIHFSKLESYFRQYHNMDSNLLLHLHSFYVKSDVVYSQSQPQDFYIIETISGDEDTNQHLINVQFVRSMDEQSALFNPSTQMRLNIDFKSLNCYIEPLILSKLIDYGYDLQDVIDQMTAFNKINYYSFIPDEVEIDAGQKISEIARMLLGNESGSKLLTMELNAGESRLLIMHSGAKIAELLINSGTNVSCFIDLDNVTLSGKLRNIQLFDHSEPTSLYPEILGLYDTSKDSVVELGFKYVFAGASSLLDVSDTDERDLILKGSINYRQFLSMDTSAIKYVHIQRFYRKAQSYISGPLLNALKREATRNKSMSAGVKGKDIISKRIIDNQIKLNIKIRSPVVIFPSNFQSKNHFLAHLGNLEVENFLIGNADTPIDHISVLLNDIMLEFISDANMQQEKIISDIFIKVNVRKPIITSFTKTKKNNEFDIAKEIVNVDFSEINFTLTHRQYQIIFDFINGNIRDGLRDVNEERKFYKSIGKLVTRRKKKDIILHRTNSDNNIDSMASSIIITDVFVTAPNISLLIVKQNGSPFAKISVTKFDLNNKIDINDCVTMKMTIGSIIATDMRSNNNAFRNFIEFSDPEACFLMNYTNDKINLAETVNLHLSDPKLVLIPELLLDFRSFFSDTEYFQDDKLKELLQVGTVTINDSVQYEEIFDEDINIVENRLFLTGNFGTPSVVIPETSDDPNSRLLILKFSSDIDFTGAGSHSEKGVFKIVGLTVFIKYGQSSLHLIEPTNVNINILRVRTQNDTNEIREERTIKVTVQEGGKARLSYHDIKMFYAIAQQFKKKLEIASQEKENDFTQEILKETTVVKGTPLIATDFKKMISEELLSQMMVNKVIFDCKSMSILVVDDVSGFDIPLVKLHLSGLHFSGMVKSYGNENRSISAYLEFIVHGDCYNFKHAEWEPIIEKNKSPIQCLYQNQKETPNHIIQVENQDMLNFNVTHSALDTIINTAKLWIKELNKKEPTKTKALAVTYEPFSIINKSGLPVSFKTVKDFETLKDEEEVRFSFPPTVANKQQFIVIKIGNSQIKTLANKNGAVLHSILIQNEELGQIENQVCVEVKDKLKRKMIIIHSGCKIRNKTDKTWQIGCYIGNEIIPLRYLEPYQHFYIPTKYIYENGSFTLRPCKESIGNTESTNSDYKWSSNVSDLYSLLLFRKTKAKTILSRNKHATVKKDHIYCIINAKTRSPEKTHISIVPPLAIQNVLQEDIQYTLFGSSTKDENIRIAKMNGYIPKGDTQYVYKIDMQKPKLWIQTMINGWQTKDINLIYLNNQNNEDLENNFMNFFRDGRSLKLKYDTLSSENAYFKIIVYCPYLIMNYTKYNLEVFDSGKEDVAFGCKTVINGTNSFMFNFEGHSMLFSDKIIIKSDDGYVSTPFTIDSVGTASEIILHHPDEKRLDINLGCFVSIATGKFERTKVIIITPRFMLVNSLLNSKDKDSVEIEVKQFGDEKITFKVSHDQPCHFYWTINHNELETTESCTPLTTHFLRKKEPMICMRLKISNSESQTYTDWSVPFSIDVLGEIPIMLGKNFIIAKILQNDGCIIVSFSRAALPPYFLVNQTNYPLEISQIYTGECVKLDANSTIPYMVPDIKSRHSINMVLNEKFRLGAMDIDRVKKSSTIAIPQLKKTIRVLLTTYRGYTRVITIKEKHMQSVNEGNLSLSSDEEPQVELVQSYIFLKGLGFSIINQHQTELCYMYLEDISLNFNVTNTSKQLFEMKVNKIGIDNQLDNATYPLLLTNANKLGMREFLHISLILDTKETEFDYIPYLSALMQEAKISFDFKVILEVFKMISSLQGKKVNHEKEAILSKLRDDLESDADLLSQFKYDSSAKSISNRMVYFELLQLHPIKLNLSFVFNETTTEEEVDLSIVLRTLGARLSMNIDEAPIRLNALILNHPPLTSRSQLLENIKAHYTRYAISELFSILGSFDIIGNPIGLFNDIDKGVYDLFYEPMEGISKSPKEFTLGIAKGTSSFFKHSIHGTFNTASKVTESLSNGISLLTLDEDYQMKRKQANQLSKRPKHIGEGLLSGAQSFSSGIIEAGTGIIMKPIEGASKEGVFGLIKGIGKGVIGIPIKPVTGALDFVYKTSEGLKNTTQYFDRDLHTNRKRFPRFIGNDKKMTCYDPNLSFGVHVYKLLKKQATDLSETERYVTHYFLANSNSIVLLTNHHICKVLCCFRPDHTTRRVNFSNIFPPTTEEVLEEVTLEWMYEFTKLNGVKQGSLNQNKVVLRVASPKGVLNSWFGFNEQFEDVILELEPGDNPNIGNDFVTRLHQMHK